ncbi:MAG: MFS transporter [Deltaproteobacteria bacterium]|nr:MFS transporter [Deltaproteobacteria bacterium]MBN2673768.1 MFS transporter [Deltaproteobacteria bacterium]
MNTVVRTQQVGVLEKLGYGCGDFASVLYWQTISAWLLYFYTDVFGITAAAAGTMILVSRLWDGVNDPMMGMLADRTNTRYGKFRPYLLWLAIPMGVVAVLTFSSPNLSPSGKLVYAWVTYVLFMMTYTAINIPYSALLGVITSDTTERVNVSFYKYLFAFTSGGVVSFIGLYLAQELFGTTVARLVYGEPNESFGWQMMMVCFAIVATGFFLITFLTTKERVQPPKKQKMSVSADLKELLHNRHWLVLLAVSLLMILFVAIRMTVTTHYFKYYVADQRIAFLGNTYSVGFVALASTFLVISQWVAVLGILGTKWIAALLGKKKAFILFFWISIVCFGAYYFLSPDSLFLIFGLQIVGSFFCGPLTPLIWAMYADTADYAEWKNGRRATGLVFSASTMSQKIGWAIGGFVAGWLLASVGFQPNVEASDSVRFGLKLLISVIPAAAGVLAALLMLLYGLDNNKMKIIEEELRRRRGENE